MPETPLMTTVEAAVFVRLSRRTLEDYRTKGTGPTYRRLGKKIYYRSGDLDAWIDARAFNSTSEYPAAQAANG